MGDSKMTAIIPDQRKYTLTEALAIAQDEANRNNIDLKFIEKGKCDNETNSLTTMTCVANDHKRKMSFMGGGSGDGLKANVKAAYEAMEDALAHQVFSTISPEKIFSFSTRSSPSVSDLQHLGLYSDLLSQPEYMRYDFPWLKLSDINHKLDALYYPLSLIYPYTTKIPHYNHLIDQSDLTELSNETSISIGASYEEAVIHALNEWIERDAYSLFLLNTIVKKKCQAGSNHLQ
jgi:ribosomal protein S12 methylthiotransferase accessory factor